MRGSYSGDSSQEVRLLRKPPVRVGQIQEGWCDLLAVEVLGPIAHLGED
jgi:hypothetical protein